MSPVLDPERPYTPFQRREVIGRIAASQKISIYEATERFKAMELANEEGLKKLVDTMPKAPEKDDDE